MKIKKTIAIFSILFILGTLATCSFNSSSDGNNTFGFPFTFYKYLGGKRFPEPTNRTMFSWHLLLLDIFSLFCIAYGLSYLIKKIRKK